MRRKTYKRIYSAIFNHNNNNNNNNHHHRIIMAPIRVAVIGGGPAAMFFCHALNKQRKEQQKNTENELLEVTCFEKASTPGGIWRSAATSSGTGTSGSSTNSSTTYGELWTNGPSHNFEFYDYTFDDHFNGEQVPVYLPRRDVNEYLMQRVLRNDPTFFEHYFEFQTEVMNVSEVVVTDNEGQQSSSKSSFRVTLRKTETGETSTRFFDKCIWAAGENAQGSIPAALRALFYASTVSNKAEEDDPSSNDPTIISSSQQDDEPVPELLQVQSSTSWMSKSSSKRVLLHSTETARIRESVRNDKRVLLIGGGFSAEDLALQCIKWGASHVDVAVRSSEAEITWMSKWPEDRVTIHKEMAVHSLDPESGDIVLEKVEFDWPSTYHPTRLVAEDNSNDENQSIINNNIEKDHDAQEESSSTDTLRLHDIDTVVFCTGYKPNLSMLDETLQPSSGAPPAWYMGSGDSMSLLNSDFSWDTWSMPTDHPAYEYTGDVPAAMGRMLRINYNHPDMHRGILFKNPNMMFLCEHGSDIPLLSLDVHAWLLCSYLTGRIPMPSTEELQRANRQQVLDQMKLPYLRYFFDEGYFRVLESKEEYWLPDGGAYEKAKEDYGNYMFRLLAGVMEEGQYPGLSLGTYEKLNENGKAMIDFGYSSYYMRADLADYEDDDEDDDEDEEREDGVTKSSSSSSSLPASLRTFRDDVVEPEYIHSLYTKSVARPLKKPWMDVSVGPSCSVRNGDI